MLSINTEELKKFNTQIPRINAYFSNKPFMAVVETADTDDGSVFAGLIRTREGFLRLALDEKEKCLVLVASKVADSLKGVRNEATGHIYPTQDSIEKVYGVAARQLRSGPLMPPDVAEFFIDKGNDYAREIGKHSADKFSFYGVRVGEHEIYTNKHVAYVIEKGEGNCYSTRVVMPTKIPGDDYTPPGIQGRSRSSLVQKYISKNDTRAQAHHQFAVHSQEMSSRFWDHTSPYRNAGAPVRLAKFFTDLAGYSRKHATGLAEATAVAAGFGVFKERELGYFLGAIALGHAFMHAALSETVSRGFKKFNNRKEARKHSSLSSYNIDEDCIKYFLKQDGENLQKPWPHLDPEKCSAENLRFLTFDEMRPMIARLQSAPERNLRPASLRGLATYGDQRGFTMRVCYPAPKAKVEISQGGLVVLKYAVDPATTEMFATYRPDACIAEKTRLPEAYIRQLREGGNIQHITYNANASFPESPYSQKTVTYAEMEKTLKGLLFKTENSSPEHFIGPIAPVFRRHSYDYIRNLFSPYGASHDDKIFMNGHNPILPTVHSIV